MEIVAILFAVTVGVVLGWYAREYQAMRTLSKFAEQIQEQDEQNSIKIKVERQGDQLYVYNSDSGEFMAQGTDIPSLDQALTARFPGRKFKVHAENLEELGVKHESI